MSKNLFDLLKTHNLRQVKLVLESQCDVNCRNDKKETPLMVCMVYLDDAAKRKEVIRLFKKKGADSNLQNSRGQTALIYSCALNQPDSAAILLEEGDGTATLLVYLPSPKKERTQIAKG